ncbi:MAG: hypothetical protein JSR33_06950 [Proteobacteria bacterium]|nr:hypothetical protein [Pseudomonadota bacterium]
MGKISADKRKKHPSLGVKLRRLTRAFTLAGSLLLIQANSLADQQDDASFTCASAVNVMDCIRQTGAAAPTKDANLTSIPINSQTLGFSGPVSIGLHYDNYLAWILDAGYVQSFYNTAAAFKLSAGLNERRANVTLGYALTPQQQIKLTYEYLAQNLPFDFSTGTVNQWVNQNAFGGAYRYLLNNGIVRALELYGTYTKANSKDLSSIEMYTDNQLTDIDYRRIAGGTEATTGGAVTLTPFQNTILKLGAGYSTLSFANKWSSSDTNSVLAYDAEISQLLTPTLMVSGGVGNTASGSTYTAKISKILPWSLEGSLTGQYMATTNDIPGSTSVTASLSYPAPKAYTNVFTQNIGNIKQYVQQPVIYNTRVLARAEEKKVSVQIQPSQTIPAQTVPVGKEISTVSTKNYFSYNTETLDKIEYIPTVTQKGTVVIYPLAALNLTFKMLDNYNGELTSGQIPASAMSPTQNYTVTFQANGYRGNQIVTTASNAFDISVTTNTALKNGTWIADAKLTPATTGAPYPGTDLTKFVKDNSGLAQGDNFVFKLESYTPTTSVQWLQISDDGKSLIAVPGVKVPTQAGNPTHVKLSGHSTVSLNPILDPNTNSPDETYDMVVNYAGSAPTWKNDSDNLPDANFDTLYAPAGGVNYNVANYIDSTGNTDKPTDLVYNCTDCTPGDSPDQQKIPNITGLTFYNTGVIAGTPSDFSQVSNTPYTFHVIATNSSKISSVTHAFNLKLGNNTKANPPTWRDNMTLPPAAINNNNGYSVNLNDYVQDNNYTNSLTYTVNKVQNCNWLIWDSTPKNSNMLTGKPSQSDVGKTCVIDIIALSAATGYSSSFSGKNIQVLGSTIYPTQTIPSAAYQENYYKNTPINLNQYFSDGDSTDTFTFTVAKTPADIPEGMTLSSAGLLGGKPTNINNINSASLSININSTNHPELNVTNYTVPGFTVLPNPDLDMKPAWKTASLPIKSATNNTPYTQDVTSYITIPDSDVLSNYQLSTNTCSGWLSINSSGVLSGTPTSTNSCKIVVQAMSKATGIDQTVSNPSGDDNSQTIAVTSNAPVWKNNGDNTIPYNFSQQTNKISEDMEKYITSDTSDADFKNFKYDTNDFINKNSPMFPLTLTIPTGTSNHEVDSAAAPTADDVDNSASMPSSFTIDAVSKSTPSEPASTGTFHIRVTGTVTPPQANSSVLLDPIMTGQTNYSVDINPYSVNGTKYMSQTTVLNASTNNQDLIHNDSLTFVINHSNKPNDYPDCSWAAISSAGVISGTPPSNYAAQQCNVSFDVHSSRANNSSPNTGFLVMPVKSTSVDWDQNKISAVLPLQFDATQALFIAKNIPATDNAVIELDNLINNPTNNTNYGFFLDTDKSDSRLTLYIDTTTNKTYLLLKDTDSLDASLINQNVQAFVSIVSNGITQPAVTLNIQFKMDSNLVLGWNNTASGCQQTFSPVVVNDGHPVVDKTTFNIADCLTAFGIPLQHNSISPTGTTNFSIKAQDTNDSYQAYATPDYAAQTITFPNPSAYNLGDNYYISFDNIKSAASGDTVLSFTTGSIINVGKQMKVQLTPQDNVYSTAFGGVIINLINFNRNKTYKLVIDNYPDDLKNLDHSGSGTSVYVVLCPLNSPQYGTGCKVFDGAGNVPTWDQNYIGQDGTTSAIFAIDGYTTENPYILNTFYVTVP